MEIRQMKIGELIPYENNPRKNDAAVDAVAASIREFGFKVPIIVDKDNVIVAGHTRLKAAKKLGLSTVPVILADDLTDEQVKAFRLADNKTGEIAEWDDAKLLDELAELQAFEMQRFGFDDLLNSEPTAPDFEEDANDAEENLPKGHLYICALSAFGKTEETLFAFEIREEEAGKILESLKEKTPEEAGEKIRGLINAL